jgi:transposase
MFMIQDSGILQTVVTDNAKEETAGDWKATCRKYHIKQEQTVPYSPWRNAAENSIRELKVGIRRAS